MLNCGVNPACCHLRLICIIIASKSFILLLLFLLSFPYKIEFITSLNNIFPHFDAPVLVIFPDVMSFPLLPFLCVCEPVTQTGVTDSLHLLYVFCQVMSHLPFPVFLHKFHCIGSFVRLLRKTFVLFFFFSSFTHPLSFSPSFSSVS